MKKSFIISALLILALTILLLGGACTPKEEAPAGTITLKLTHYFPASMYFQVEQCPRYFEMVEKAAKGKYTLNIEYYPVGTLIAPADIHDGTVKGITDIGLATPGYTPGRCPVMETILVPGVAPEDDCYTGSLIFWEFYKKYKPEEYADVKMLYCYSVGPGYIHSKTPIRSVADMEDVKMRVYGTMVPAVKLLGGEPVAMPMADLYEAVTKGLLDAVVGPPETLKSHKHAELFDYSTFVPGLYHGLQVLIMNLETWDSLPGDLQDAFEDVADDAVKLTGRIWQYYQQDGFDYALAQPGGHTIIELPAAELAKMHELLEPVVDEYIAELNSKGLPGEEMVEEANKLAEKNNKLTFEPWEP